MPMLDFIKNRHARQQSAEQPSQQSKPETAREMYAQQASQEKATARTMDQMPTEQKGRVDQIKADLQKASQNPGQDAPPNTPAPADSTASPQPMAQKMMNQDKAAPALSPTSAQAGTRATEQQQSAPSENSQSKAQKGSPDRSQTVARRPPSWER